MVQTTQFYFKAMVLWSSLLALSACNSLGFGSGVAQPIAVQSTQNVASANLISALDGGLISRIPMPNLIRADRSVALQNEYRALEYTAPGEAVLWKGNGLDGRIVPSQPYRVGTQDCRQYEHSITIGGAAQTAKGTACRNQDGSWSLLS